MESEGLFALQKPAILPDPKPYESNLSSFRYILMLLLQLRPDPTSSFFASHISTKILYAFLTCPMRVSFYAYLTPLDFTALIIFGEKNKIFKLLNVLFSQASY
jgi:hypothetical protein